MSVYEPPFAADLTYAEPAGAVIIVHVGPDASALKFNPLILQLVGGELRAGEAAEVWLELNKIGVWLCGW